LIYPFFEDDYSSIIVDGEYLHQLFINYYFSLENFMSRIDQELKGELKYKEYRDLRSDRVNINVIFYQKNPTLIIETTYDDYSGSTLSESCKVLDKSSLKNLFNRVFTCVRDGLMEDVETGVKS
jgi:hypothetical protein